MTIEPGLTCTPWYDGSLKLWQADEGFRATTDAVLVAAAVDADCRHVVELGAGGGAASLALARRCPQMQITAIERDPLMAGLLGRNISENDLSDRLAAIHADIHDNAAMAGLAGRHDHVFFNPPYNDEASSLSSTPRRRTAMAGDDLGGWIRVAAGLLADRGGMTLISRADRLPDILAACGEHHLGETVLRAVHSRPGQPAIRILVSARKGLRGRLVMLPPLILRDDSNTLTATMQAISHDCAALGMKAPGRQYRLPPLPDSPSSSPQ
ncbi:MAG: tRNA1(Val) (adenine(37)-N6)-methyltransferase [Candidatus Puniceispirillales bacterium]